MTPSNSGKYNLLDQIAEELAQRYRRGEQPSLREYQQRHPDLAEEIQDLFPALMEVEQAEVGRPEPTSRPGTVPPAPPLHQVGDYRLLREVGRGGMGVVYEAEQVSLGRRVALKILPLHAGGDGKALERFRCEARAAARLHHTNIVPVHEVGQDGNVCFYAMQFISGQSLDQIIDELRRLRARPARAEGPPAEDTAALRPRVERLAQSLLTGRFQVDGAIAEPLPSPNEGYAPTPAVADAPSGGAHDRTASAVLTGQTGLSSVRRDRHHYFQSVARIGMQTAGALAYAHARQIIHRDIKPSNLLLDPAGVVWTTDFGLARTQDAALTTTGDIVGTLRYMAPERFQGGGDERADVYGLGLTLYELLVLRPAFQTHDRLQLIDRIKNEEPTRPRAVDPCIPRDLETIVLKAMHKEAGRRYQTAEEMAEDLRRFLADEPIRARRTTGLVRLRLWARRNPALAVLAVVLLLVAAASTATAFYLQGTLAESEAHRLKAEEAEREGKHELWRSYLTQARAWRMSRQPGQRFGSLRAIQAALALPAPPGRSPDELRTEAVAALCLPDLELAHEGGTETVGARGFTIDPAFRRYAVADGDGRVRLYRLSDDRELLDSPLPGGGGVEGYRGLEFSPDGRYLHQRCQVRNGFRSRLWDLQGPRPRVVLDDNHVNLAFRPDGRELAAAYPDRTIRFFDTLGHQLRQFPHPLPPLRSLRWNPRLPRLVLYEGTSLELMNVDNGEVAAVKLGLPGGYGWADWHPEGRLLAVAGLKDRTIYLWDVAESRLALPPLEGHKVSGVVMRFNHAGDRLLSSDWSACWHLWDTRTGQLLLTLPAGVLVPCFSPDDRLVGTGGQGKVQTYRLRRGEELRTVHHTGANKQRRDYKDEGFPCVAPDNRLAAITTEDGVALVDLARWEEAALLKLPRNYPLRFDQEGALWTYGTAGLLRWPAAADPKTGLRRYGPRQRTAGAISGNFVGSSSSDGRVVTMIDKGRGVYVLHRDNDRLLRLGPQDDVRYCALSPDGRWVATGSHGLRAGAGAKVWDARDGHHIKDLRVGGLCKVRFSPDGKWLLTTGGGAHLWAVGSWEEGPSLGSSPLNSRAAFSCDGKLLALGDAPGVVRLMAADTGAEIARLTAPEQDRLAPCCFTPDGTQLLAIAVETRVLRVFDLRAIRAGLAELRLDWDAPPLPAPAALPATPLSLQFELRDVSPSSSIKKGTYKGVWQGAGMKLTIEKVSGNNFTGIVHMNKESEWPDLKFNIKGEAQADGSIIFRRVEDQWKQVVNATPKGKGKEQVWKGALTGPGTDQKKQFELQMP
jgi:serine/threonine protein kinase/WD40 repeat protein